MLTSFLRHVTLSNSCGANAHTFPRDPLKGSFHFSPPPHIFLHEICAISPELGNPDTRLGHVRLEARRMKPPALAACRACVTTCFAHRVSGARQLSSPRRVHSPKKLECRSPGRWHQKRKNSLVGRGSRNPLAAERWLSWSFLVHPVRVVT